MTLITREHVFHHFLFNIPAGFPYKYRRSVEWLEDHHHGINYSARGISYEGTTIIENFPADAVSVKGKQKEDFVGRFYKNVINIEHLDDSPKIEKNTDYCSYHNKLGYARVCSYYNVKILAS